MVAPFHIGSILSIFTPQPLEAVIPDISELRTALLAVLIAHQATCGCKPTAEQMDVIARHSGAAVMAIMSAMKDAAMTHAEAQH